MIWRIFVLFSIFWVSAIQANEIHVPAKKDALIHAIAQAQSGDTLLLAAIRYDGPLVISTPLTLQGQAGSHIQGNGEGRVISVRAPNVRISGIRISGSGLKLNTLDAGIELQKTATSAQILHNHLDGNLIGVDVHGAKNTKIAHNVIIGRNDLRVPERGPGIYVWDAPDLVVEDNVISKGRDGVFITTSHKAQYRRNHFSKLRYAFHAMYANQLVVEDNVSHDNAMGFAFMYSRKITARRNLSSDDRDHGFFMNFANNVTLEDNAVRQGKGKCLFLYNSNNNTLRRNRFEGCVIGIHFTAGSANNLLQENAFLGNQTQVKYVGTRWLEWSHAGRGNFWSDHISFDIDGNGITDSPYRPNDLTDQLIWSQPMVKMLIGSPAMQFISWSQSRFPGLLPGGVMDSYPLMQPITP